jgi:hypothetical protein
MARSLNPPFAYELRDLEWSASQQRHPPQEEGTR